ncbi:unnamed protein product [Closterium sp. NIES-54]
MPAFFASPYPSRRAYDQVLRGTFEGEVLPNQELLSQPDTWKRVLNQLPDQELQDRMDATWRSDSRRASAAADVNMYRWQQLEATTRAAAKKNVSLRKAVEEIVFAFTYPRLDLEQALSQHHSLPSWRFSEAPFCGHCWLLPRGNWRQYISTSFTVVQTLEQWIGSASLYSPAQPSVNLVNNVSILPYIDNQL